jgi:hypothetical protein
MPTSGANLLWLLVAVIIDLGGLGGGANLRRSVASNRIGGLNSWQVKKQETAATRRRTVCGGLDVEADDYLTKPFSCEVLAAAYA